MEKYSENYRNDLIKIPSPFSRVGSKNSVKEELNLFIPKHKVYIEPFVGSGTIYFYKPPAAKSILNDSDGDLIKAFNLIKKIDVKKAFPIYDTIKDIQKFVDHKTTNPNERFMQILYKMHNTYGNMGKGKILRNYKLENITTHFNDIQNKILNTNTKIYNKNAFDIILENAKNKNAFFFIDPPYENSTELYKDNNVDYNLLKDILEVINGKFLLTLNDSVKNRKIFKYFYIKTMSLKSPSVKNVGGNPMRKEIWITNYDINKLNALST
jgi:DNA adenine methylase